MIKGILSKMCLLLLLLLSKYSIAQKICTLLKPIDSSYYLKFSLKSSVINKQNLPVKTNHIIKFKFGNKFIKLKDNLSDKRYFEYFYEGIDEKRNWLLIKGQDYNQDYFYLFNKTNNTIDTLVGFPGLYDNKIICLEGDYTDGHSYIEMWDITDNSLSLKSKFSITRECQIFQMK